MWIIVAAYLAIGVACVLRDLSQPFTNRPPYLGRQGTRLTGMCFKVLLWPFMLRLPRHHPRNDTTSANPVEVGASEDVVDLYNQGTIASSKGRYERAIELFTQAIDRDPSFVPAYINRGNAHSKLNMPNADTDFYEKQSDSAIADYSKAIQLDPTNSQAFYNRAGAKYVKGNHEDALSDIEHARSLGYTDIDSHIEEILKRHVQANAAQR